jgi:hypothetical protein
VMEVQDAKLEEMCVFGVGEGSGGCSRKSLGCAMYDKSCSGDCSLQHRSALKGQNSKSALSLNVDFEGHK